MNCPRNIIIAVVLVGTIALTQAHAAAERDSIRIRSTAELTPGAVRLADIAVIKVAAADLNAQLADLVVTQLPSGITAKTLGVFDIYRVLHQADIPTATMDIYGATRCQVTVDSPEVSAEELPAPESPDNNADDQSLPAALDGCTLADELDRTIARLSGLAESRLVIEWQRGSQHQLLQAPFDERRFSIKPRSQMGLGRVCFEVTDRRPVPDGVLGNASPAPVVQPRPITLRANVEYLCESVVTARPLAAGELITVQDIEIKPCQIRRSDDVGLTDLQNAVGHKTIRPIGANTIITSSMIRKLHLVKRQEAVSICSKVGAVEITSIGRALDDGALGDVIAVCYARDNRKVIVRGRITGPAEVTITSAIEGSQSELALARPADRPGPLTAVEN